MTLTAQQKFLAGFALLLLIPLILCVMAARTSQQLAESAEDVAHTNGIEKQLAHLLSDLKDIEMSEREFILTGNQKLLGFFKTGRSNIAGQIARLRELTSDNERQRVQFDLLEPLIPQKFDEMEKAIELRNTEGVAAASKVILIDEGTRAMDDINTVIQRMMLEEERLLQVRTKAQKKSFALAMGIFGLMLVLNILLVWALSVLFKRDVAKREKEEERIRQLNAELESRVEQRTEALRRSNEDLQQFAYVASHDLQEPLRMVASYTELLKRRYKGKLDADADQFIEYAVDGVRRMNQLIQDLLAYSRAGETAPGSLKQVNPEDLLKTLLADLQVIISDAGATITHDPLPEIEFDPIRLSQIFQNLLTNAIKYRGGGPPRIHITARTGTTETIFAIADNGMGIEPEYYGQIFGIFKRLHGREYEGTGIGLAMCKKIVERHGGRIWVESKPGEGSTFSFSIPKYREARAAGAA